MEPLWDGGTKVCSNGLGHMTKMAAMIKPFKNLLRNQMAPYTLSTQLLRNKKNSFDFFWLNFSSIEPMAKWWAYSMSSLCCRCLSSVAVVCQHFQTSSPLKPLGRLKSNFM